MPASNISLESQIPPPSSYPVHPAPISGELKFSRTRLYKLKSLLMRSHHPTPKIKEALHQVKIELNSSENFPSETSSQRISKQSQQMSRVGLSLVASTLSTNVSSY